MNIGQVLKNWRGQKSIREAARNAGIAHQTLADMEENKYDPKLSTVIKVCTAYGKTINDLLHEAEIL